MEEIRCPGCKTPLKPTQDGLYPKHKLPAGHSRHEHRKRKRVFCVVGGLTVKPQKEKQDDSCKN